ncbi:DUF5079 family protein [Mammaliicoccus sp. Dog046]|uniref:DUF5079 family protein n=1 Tax=Mammaliicoccus sp. Dog046 TaxID=3034233 RepID=UPI002B260BB1|nr:DUF5079 family protein [Mammaliicoccus sp. Dog046]WQK85602.1 DUF5079 family protein [Mammaliicoccus sp. Dog046]
MSINESIDELRKPGVQVVSFFNLGFILYSFLVFFNGLDYKYLPNYLKIVTIIELLIVVIGLLQYFRFISFDENFQVNKVLLKRYAKFLTIVNFLGIFNAVFVINNLFYFIAIQNHVDLFPNWLMSMLVMLICFILWSTGLVLMWNSFPKLEKYISGKRRTFIGIGLALTSCLVIIFKIVEYIILPNAGDSKFIVPGSILVILGCQLATAELIKRYASFKILVLDKEY